MATRKTQKTNSSDYKQTTKQENKEINKQATNVGYYGYYTYYIHWASKFATSANIGNKAAYYIHWLSKLATSANKRGNKTSPEMKPLQKSSRNIVLGTHHAGNKLIKLISFLLFGAKILQHLLVHQKVCI